MLPKQHRLSSKDFSIIKKEGRKSFGPFFGLLTIEGEKEKSSKFGFIVSKKIDKRAVVRNKVRRRLSQALLSFLPEVKSGIKAIFLTKRNLINKEFVEIKKEIERMFKKEGIL